MLTVSDSTKFTIICSLKLKNTHGHKNWILSQRVVSSLISYKGEIHVYLLWQVIKEGVYSKGTMTSVTGHLYVSRVKTVIYSDFVGLNHLTVIDLRHEVDWEWTKPSSCQVISQITTNCTTNQITPCEHSLRIGVRTSVESFETSQSSRQAEDDVDKTRRSSTSQGKDSIDKTTRIVIETVEESDDKLGPSGGTGAKTNVLYWTRTDGRQPSCNHQSRTNNNIVSDYKAKNYIHRSTTVQRELSPRTSEKRPIISSLSDITKTILNSTFFFFFLLFVTGAEPKQGKHKVQWQETNLFTLDDLIQSKT